ncbi:hypothetical protein QLX56_07385 [Enterococcus faecium]|uniref:hypothetical protein n=1 Tax=Enterococcus faecium TaxID=1352 RepID=UPI0038913416
MEAGKVLQEVKVLCADKKYEEAKSLIEKKKYEEAKSLIEKNKENLEEKYPIAQEFVELKQGTLLHRFKHFFGITE